MMSQWRAILGALGVLGGVVACGSAPTPSIAALAPGAARRVAPPVVTRLPLPANALLVGRWANPQQWLDAVGPWAENLLPLEIALRSRLARASVPIDLSAPLEWLVTLDTSQAPPQLSWALSLSLSQSVGEPLVERIVSSPAGLACRQAVALGVWSSRVVCSHSEEALMAHLPAMTRALPLAKVSTGNLAMQFHRPAQGDDAEPLAEQWLLSWLATKLGVQTRNDAINIQLTELAGQLDEELRNLLADFDGAILSVAPTGAERLSASLQMPFRSPASHWLRSRVGNAAAGLAPQQFWHFPVDAQEAGFHWSVQWQHLNAQRSKLADLLGSILEFRGLPKRLEIQARQLLATLPFPQAPVAWARGGVPAADSAGVAGWNIHTFGGGLAEVRYFLNQLNRTLDDPVVGPQLGRLFRAAFGRNRTPQTIRLRNVRGGLPPGSFRVDVLFRAPTPTADAAAALSLFFAPSPDGGFAVAWGEDAEQLRKLLLPSRKGDWSRTLAGRAGLGELNNRRVLRGGFTSLALLQNENVSALLSELFLLPMRSVTEAPHGGATPILADWTLIQAPDNEPAILQLQAMLTATALRDFLFSFGID